MKSCIESLESRQLLSAVLQDRIAIVTDERALLTDLTLTNRQVIAVRSALGRDLSRLHLLRPNAAVFNTLAKQQTKDIIKLSKDVHTLIVTGVKDQSLLLNAASDYVLHQNLGTSRNTFNAALAKFEQDYTNNRQKFVNDLATATTGPVVTDLNAVGALAPTDLTLQSDVLTGVTNLNTSSTTLTTQLGFIDADFASLVSDSSGVKVFGSENLLGKGFGPATNPFSGAILKGLAGGLTSAASTKYAGPDTFLPSADALPGTDLIYVGSGKVATTNQVVGPQTITLDYSALTQLGKTIKTFTLGIATDGFENPTIHQPYIASINGVVSGTLTTLLNSIDGAGRVEEFVSVGIDPSQLTPSKTLTLTIDGPGGSGWAVDFLTVGINNG